MNFKQQLQEAYEAGYNSSLNEQQYPSNPYPPDSIDHLWWERMHRIEEHFTDLFTKEFGKNNTMLEFVDTKMSFPSAEEYAVYYWSTLLWRESTVGKTDNEILELKEKSIDIIKEMPDFILNKQMSCLVGSI